MDLQILATASFPGVGRRCHPQRSVSFNAELDSWIANMTDGRGSASIGAPALDLVPLDLGMSPLPAQKSFFGSIARASEGSVDWRCGSTTGQRFAASLLVDLSS